MLIYGQNIDQPEENINHSKSEPIDLHLWKSFKEGDEGAFITIYQSYIDCLFNLGKQFTYDSDLIKDCLQDFFIYLRQHREKLSDTDNIKLYLFKSFRRHVIGVLKKRSKYFLSDSSIKESIFPVEIAVDEKMINDQYQQQQLENLNQALKKLPVKEREAIYYYYYQKFTYQEIANLYGYDHISSSRRLIYKSLKKLRDLF